MNKGMLVVFSAPSGCGKDTVFKELCKVRNDIVESVSATTRKPRDGEVDGVNYYFLSDAEFDDMVKNNGFVEHACYNGCSYGTPVKGVDNAINNGKICFLIIEVQGAQRVMELYPDCVSIFLLPPSEEVLLSRLRKRNTESEDEIQKRIETSRSEIALKGKYKYNVINDGLDACVNEINKILSSELKLRNKQ